MMTIEERLQLDENCRLTRKIHEAIVGDDALGQSGLVGQVRRAHERMDQHETDDRRQFDQVKDDTRKLGDKISRIIYLFAGVVAAVKVAGWLIEVFGHK